MIRSTLALLIVAAFTTVAAAETVRSSRSDLQIGSMPTGDSTLAVISLGAGLPFFSVHAKNGKLDGVRVPAGFPYVLSWRGGSDDDAFTFLEIRKEVSGTRRVLVELIAISRKDLVSFADDEAFKRFAGFAEVNDGLELFLEQFVKDVSEDTGEQATTGNDGKASLPSAKPEARRP